MKSNLLSQNRGKIQIYESDPYYRDCIDDINNYFGDGVVHKLQNIAPVIFRPDSIITRHCFTILDKILAYGYKPIYISPFEYCRFKVRECWKYQLNIATRDRIDVMDMILIGSPCLYVIFYKDFSGTGASATNYLSKCKGPSLPEERMPQHLRYSNESAQVSVFTYVHVSDEIIDIIREIGAFFCREQRIQIIKSVINPKLIDVYEYFRTLADNYELHSLKYEDIRRKAENSYIRQTKQNKLIQAFDKLENNKVSWRDMKIIMEEHKEIFNYWDIVSVCAQFADTHYQGKNPIVEDII